MNATPIPVSFAASGGGNPMVNTPAEVTPIFTINPTSAAARKCAKPRVVASQSKTNRLVRL